MVLRIKRQILSQFRQLGLHFEPSTLRVLPPSEALNVAGVGSTFSIDLPNETNQGSFDQIYSGQIQNSLLKNIKSDSSFIEQVLSHQSNNQDEPNRILFKLNFQFFVKELLSELSQDLSKLTSHYRRQDEIEFGNENYCKKIIVEYSSPNIAKPFHVGNLRSTIIGNCVANLLKFKGHNVIRMNYLGDWGTQFGILSLAFDNYGDEEQLKKDPLKHLFEVYVKGNREIESNQSWREMAKERFSQLEFKTDSKVLEQWNRFRDLSLRELKSLYHRLGITFDFYASESMYCDSSHDIVNVLQNRGLLEESDDGALLASVPDYENSSQTIRVPLIKNDGSTLYLSRDIAAALHRQEQYQFDRMYYVVDSSQSKHFNNLKSIISALGNPIYKEMKHLKFGRILGMSTRKGEAIFLEDVLNEAKGRALEAIRNSPNTKIDKDQFDKVSDILGVSAIIIHDFANRRLKEYRFNWNKALRMNGDTGISLQYTHARLCNLAKNCEIEINPNCDIFVSAIDTLEGRILINQLAMFHQVIEQTYEMLEPNVLTCYLFDLKAAINRANQELTIKGEKMEIAQTRLLLFNCARNVLSTCLRLLGLYPLQSM